MFIAFAATAWTMACFFVGMAVLERRLDRAYPESHCPHCGHSTAPAVAAAPDPEPWMLARTLPSTVPLLAPHGSPAIVRYADSRNAPSSGKRIARYV
ncbi:hypothetical protein [Nocardia sp. R7R-8]|uniref:hypothetical protein n=1 Tax=Nocardia sp. R7R-8 TaxID=3459304 RepID=UPI00403DEDE1